MLREAIKQQTQQLVIVTIIATLTVSLFACSSPKPLVVSKARNRNMAVIFSNLKTNLDKDVVDDMLHGFAEGISKTYYSKVFPFNFAFNELLDYKAVYLCGVRDVDTVIVLDGEVTPPQEQDVYLFKGVARVLNPSTFKEMLSYPVAVGPKDYRDQDIPSDDTGKIDLLVTLLSKRATQALKIILPDPNNFPRANALHIADLLFEKGQYRYALDLYKQYRQQNPDYIGDSSLVQRLENNIQLCTKEIVAQKNRKEFSLTVDLANVPESMRSLFQGVVSEGYMEEELRHVTVSPSTLTIDYDNVFNRCFLKVGFEFDRNYYEQNLPIFRIPETFNKRKVITLAPYRNIFKELLWLKRNLTRHLGVMYPGKPLYFDMEIAMGSFRQQVLVSVESDDDRTVQYGNALTFISHDKRKIPLRSTVPKETEKSGLFVLGELFDRTGQISGYGLLHQFFAE